MAKSVEPKDVDLFRDTPVRYLGYTNEVGEAFRSIVPKSVVWLSYVIASGYVVADTIHKGMKEHAKDTITANKNKRIVQSTFDTLLWQSLASVIVPGFVINRICAGVIYAQKNAKNRTMRSPWASTIVGLISIPFIIRPIDQGIDVLMDKSYRQWTGYHPHKDNDD